MPQHLAKNVVENMDRLFEEIRINANLRNLGVYKNTIGFNIDHFFSLAVQQLGGTLREVPEIGDMRPELDFNRGMPPGEVAVLHHVNEKQLSTYAKYPTNLRSFMYVDCNGVCR